MRDHNTKVKQRIRDQLNSDTWELATKRDAEMYARSEQVALGNPRHKNFSWKVPEIEQIDRHFNET